MSYIPIPWNLGGLSRCPQNSFFGPLLWNIGQVALSTKSCFLDVTINDYFTSKILFHMMWCTFMDFLVTFSTQSSLSWSLVCVLYPFPLFPLIFHPRFKLVVYRNLTKDRDIIIEQKVRWCFLQLYAYFG